MHYRDIKVIGHRGAAGMAIENSKDAFDIAVELGLEWVETDIRFTNDNVPVLCHDAYFKDKLISEITFDELSSLSRNSIYDLKSFIYEYSDKLNFNFDVKDCESFPSLIKIIQDCNIGDKVIISSFNHKSLLNAKNIYSDLRYAPLIASRSVSLKHFLEPFMPLMDLIVMDCDFCDTELIHEADALGFEVYLYNVNTPAQADLFIPGVKGIIVNKPKLFSIN